MSSTSETVQLFLAYLDDILAGKISIWPPREVITMGGKPSKGTPADKRIKGNKPPVKKS